MENQAYMMSLLSNCIDLEFSERQRRSRIVPMLHRGASGSARHPPPANPYEIRVVGHLFFATKTLRHQEEISRLFSVYSFRLSLVLFSGPDVHRGLTRCNPRCPSG